MREDLEKGRVRVVILKDDHEEVRKALELEKEHWEMTQEG